MFDILELFSGGRGPERTRFRYGGQAGDPTALLVYGFCLHG